MKFLLVLVFVATVDGEQTRTTVERNYDSMSVCLSEAVTLAGDKTKGDLLVATCKLVQQR